MDSRKLICLIYQRRGMWDRHHPSNRSLYAQGVLWEEVVRELNSTSYEVKAKWQTLEHSFRKIMRRIQMRGYGVNNAKCVDDKSMQRFRRLYFLKSQYRPSESNGHIPPKEKRVSGVVPTDAKEEKNSRSDQTREEKVESSKLSKLDDVPADTMDAETDTSGPLAPNEQQTTLSIDSGTTNQVTGRSYETAVGSAPPEIQRPKLKVSEDGRKERDEDVSFFESLIPHVKGLSPARKMLLRMKTQELIYNFIYN
ncbi:hypothetical protein B7P43_G17482 [Cryptotermes secundus]|uniref:MADF domain-containing protein n=1 Tax=Cryptotermes secundus TaxID=105785 RepID=A0A2J7RQP7_9NEOP|nr:hypothetical protein B7P43_G17482 [Cryptotermes secundus]